MRCPQGHLSQSWREIVNERDNQVIEVHFDRTVCAACVARKDACAMNLSRFMAWFQQVPKAKTRTSPFAALGLNA